MKENKNPLKEVIKLYYGEPTLSDSEIEKVDEILKSVERKGLKGDCLKIIQEREEKIWKFGRFCINKAACIVIILCLALVSVGFIAFTGYIKNIQIKDKENYSSVEINYKDDPNAAKPEKIGFYQEPIWIPEGYCVDSVYKKELEYTIIYQSNDGCQIVYHQFLPVVNYYFSGENGKSEPVSFGKYSGEFIETDDGNYLVVTDGIYFYSLIADDIDRDSLVKMLIRTNVN